MRARRVTVYKDHRGEWRYRVQSGNWRVIDASEEGFKQKRTAVKRVGGRWPGVEVVVDPDPESGGDESEQHDTTRGDLR